MHPCVFYSGPIVPGAPVVPSLLVSWLQLIILILYVKIDNIVYNFLFFLLQDKLNGFDLTLHACGFINNSKYWKNKDMQNPMIDLRTVYACPILQLAPSSNSNGYVVKTKYNKLNQPTHLSMKSLINWLELSLP